jgi:hypothetical protein
MQQGADANDQYAYHSAWTRTHQVLYVTLNFPLLADTGGEVGSTEAVQLGHRNTGCPANREASADGTATSVGSGRVAQNMGLVCSRPYAK